jgi:hypothetical protein
MSDVRSLKNIHLFKPTLLQSVKQKTWLQHMDIPAMISSVLEINLMSYDHQLPSSIG